MKKKQKYQSFGASEYDAMSNVQIARLLGVGTETVRRWRIGEREMPKTVLSDLRAAQRTDPPTLGPAKEPAVESADESLDQHGYPAPDRTQARNDASRRQSARLGRQLTSLASDVAADAETMAAICKQVATVVQTVSAESAQRVAQEARECLAELRVYTQLVQVTLGAIEVERA